MDNSFEHIEQVQLALSCVFALRKFAGLELVPLAREAVRLSTRIEETMASNKGEIHGHLHVGCSTTPGKYRLPHILAQFHQSHPPL